MNTKVARYGLWFYIITMVLALLFPKFAIGNIYAVVIYLLVCLVFIYVIYFRKKHWMK